MITEAIKKKICTIVSVFETSSLTPRYDMVTVLPDGPRGSLMLTYGAHQVTERSGLKGLIEAYSKSYGTYARQFKPYVPLIGTKSLHGNYTFKHLLKQAGGDPVMQDMQDAFFEINYYFPAYNFLKNNGFTLPLSMLVIYDSYIHSGGLPAFLRDDFKEVPPIRGGEEKAYINAYVHARDYWLEHHANKVLRNTDYRTDCFKEQILNCNWMLDKPVICKFNRDNKTAWITIP